MKIEIDKSLWKTDDKQWMAERKQEWRHISKSLDVIRSTPNYEIKKKHFKYFKDLFFTGEYHLTEEDILHFEIPMRSELFFIIWFYPEKSVAAYRELIDLQYKQYAKDHFERSDSVYEYGGFVDYFMSISSSLGFDSEYGFMGGREVLLVQALFPSLDYDDVIKITEKNGDKEAIIHLGPKPEKIYEYAVADIYSMFKGFDKACNLPATYMWPYLDYAIQKQPDCLGSLGEEVIVYVLYILKYTDKFKAFPKDRAHVVEFADNLRNKFMNNEFGDVLMGYWNNVDSLYKQYTE